MSEHIHYLSDDDFEAEVLLSPLPVLLDFWAEWCVPCKRIGPLLDEIAEQYAGRLKVAKMDVDSNPLTPAQFDVRSIPTLVLLKNGNVEETRTGAMQKSQLIAFIDSHL